MGEKSKMSKSILRRDGHLVFPINPKNTNLVEDVGILLPVKFRRIRFSIFAPEKKIKVSQPITCRVQVGLSFPIGPNNTNLIEDVKILLPANVR